MNSVLLANDPDRLSVILPAIDKRRFRETVGMSPYRFLQSVRVSEAAALLRRGSHSVTDAALSVGFTDLGRFAQAFRRELGCAPSAFQRAHASAAYVA